MRLLKALLSCLLISLLFSLNAHAILSMELTRGQAGAIPIAIVPFATTVPENAPNISQIISNDLQNSGRFKVYSQKELTIFPRILNESSSNYFKKLGTDNVVLGRVDYLGDNRYQVSMTLADIYRGQESGSTVFSKQYTVRSNELRAIAHHLSDLIYQQLTGVKGIFSTKLAYVVIKRGANNVKRYELQVADQDGFNPKRLLDSSEPIMSPAWSPNGKKIAYVSFEKRHASVYIQDVHTGERQLLSEFPGINGAPAWSPDGSKLALVLSKSGSPNIYVMPISGGKLTQVTQDAYINTEPAWSADGQSIIFTSNRSGGPQIYQVNLASGATSRLSYDGDYNARATFAKDNRNIAMIHRVSGIYNIAILDLNSGTTKVLTTATSGDSASPSIAPNGSMILYDTVYGGRNVLAMVSADGRVQLVLPARDGEAQDPAWSPFLS